MNDRTRRRCRLLFTWLLAGVGCDKPEVDPVAPPAAEPVVSTTTATKEPDAAGAGETPAPAARHSNDPRGKQVVSDADPYAFAVEPAEIDLGVLRPDEDAACSFEIVNLDARPLRLVNIDGSCDCVAFAYERGDLAPGGRRRVSTTIRAENRGNKLLTAFVQANDRVVTTHRVAIRYSIEPELRFDPARADFGQRVVGAPAVVDLRVRYQLPSGVSPLTFAPRLAAVLPIRIVLGQAALTELPGGIAQVDQPLRLELDCGSTLAAFRSELIFDAPGHRRAKLPLTGSVHGGMYLDPAELHLGVAEIGKTRRGTVRLVWVKEAPKVTSVTTSCPELEAQALPESGTSGRSLRVQVTFLATAAGEFEGEVRIAIEASTEPMLLPVRAKVR